MRQKAISSITVGERCRKDVGDLTALQGSLAERGMLQPVGIDESGRLVFGFRRLKAAEKIGWTTVPVVVVDKLADAVAYLKAERDENTCRKPFTASELGAMAARLLAMEKPAAKGRQAAAGGKTPGKGASETVSEAPRGEARRIVADALGVSHPTATRAAEVVLAAAADPERNGDLPAKMDAEGVKPAHRELRKRQADGPADSLGIPIPAALRPVFDSLELFAEARSLFRKLVAAVDAAAQSPGGIHYAKKLAYRERDGKGRYECKAAKDAAADLDDSTPHCCVCPYCYAKHPGRTAKDCRACLGTGWVPAVTFKASASLPADYRAAVEKLKGGAA